MKKRFYIYFIFMFINAGLLAQSSFTVYKNAVLENGSTGSTISVDFSNTSLYMEGQKLMSPTFISKEYDENNDPIPSSITYSSANIDIASLSNPRELMTMYHLTELSTFSQSVFGAAHPLVSNGNHSQVTLITNLGVNIPLIETEPFGAEIMLEYSLPSNSATAYYPLAEDAYAIARGYFTLLYKSIVNGNTISGVEGEGTDMGLSTYFAHRYMKTKTYNSSENVHVHGGHTDPSATFSNLKAWSTLSSNLHSFVTDRYYEEFATLSTSHKQSELLFASLWEIGELVGFGTLDNLIVTNLEFLSSNNPNISQAGVAAQLYINAFDDLQGDNNYQFTEGDLCNMLDIFYLSYRDVFYDLLDESMIPTLESGDIHIADNPTDIGIETPPSYYVCNSPDIWNRNNNSSGNDSSDGFSKQENQKAAIGTGEDGLNFLYVKINGDICDLTSSQTEGSNMKLNVYYNTANGSKWPADWVHDDIPTDPNEDINGHIYGDLIGTVDLSTMKCIYDDASYGGIPVDVNSIKRVNSTIIEIPWNNHIVPDGYFATKFYHDFGYLARLTSEGTPSFDPISVNEGQNVIGNAQNNNNIALKRNALYVCQPVPDPFPNGSVEPPVPGIILTGDPDPNDPNIKFTIRPASHDPEPVEPDPNDPVLPEFPVHPEFNDYVDFGEVVIVLDPEIYQSWTVGGQRGTGFTLNADNEIIVNDRDFFIEGISLPGRDIYSAIRVKFIPYTPTLEKRTAFDLVQWGSLSGKKLDAVHVEVRPGNKNSIAPRASASANNSNKVMIYPNPAQDYVTVSSNTTEISKIEVYSVSNERMNVSYQAVDTKTTRVNISDLSAGIYFMRVQSADNIETIKFVKM